ncbi:MAG TPA: 50S ribosomal protein L1 [Deltaproteobacteria bacterium]|nr:50S ribosomal protein L1 [Deltaproteobacteria bacterium]
MAGKKYKTAADKRNPDQKYSLEEAVTMLSGMKSAKFDETVEVALRLGIDAKQTDQLVRGAVSLPHGLGKSVKVLAFAKGEKEREAKESGADFVGSEDMIEKVQGGWMDFDKVVATPDMMAAVSKLGKVLGPRGLMPNPKVGTVTFEIGKAVKDLKAGKVEFRNEKAGIVQAPVGKLSFGPDKIKENILSFVEGVVKAKPSSSKGTFLKGIAISATMSPGIRIDPNTVVSA